MVDNLEIGESCSWFCAAGIISALLVFGVIPSINILLVIIYLLIICLSLIGALNLAFAIRYYIKAKPSYVPFNGPEYELPEPELEQESRPESVLNSDEPSKDTIKKIPVLISSKDDSLASAIPEGKVQCFNCSEIINNKLMFCPECGIRLIRIRSN